MKALLIDPTTLSVNEIEISQEKFLGDLYDAIGCNLVERVCIEDADVILQTVFMGEVMFG